MVALFVFQEYNLDNYDKKTFNVRAVNKFGDIMIQNIKHKIRLGTKNQAPYTVSFWLLSKLMREAVRMTPVYGS